MRKYAAMTMALALGLVCALLVSSCGGSGGTLSSSRSSEINGYLDQIQELADAGDCEAAGALAQKVSQGIQSQPDIDGKLRSALSDGLERIQALSTDSSFCGGASDTTTTETTTETTDTVTATTGTTDTTPTITTPTQTQTTPTQTTTTPTNGTGGTGGSGGIGTP